MKIVCISQVYWPDTASVAQHLVDLLQCDARFDQSAFVVVYRNKDSPDEENTFCILDDGFAA